MKKFFICFDPEMGMVEVDARNFQKTKVDGGLYVKASDAYLALSLIKDIAEATKEGWDDVDLVSIWQDSARCILKELSQ